jgi:hypothetical protein
MGPIIVYLLVLVIFTKDGPATVDHMYGTRFDCEVGEAAMLTKARDAKEVNGWAVPAECVAVPENNKI